MERKVIETMDVTAFSPEGLEMQVAQMIAQGWEPTTGVDESVHTDDKGLSIITYSRSLARYEQNDSLPGKDLF